ncbi:MAG: hypothetical protein ABI181_03880 [Mycobacteriaceae bacterium]
MGWQEAISGLDADVAAGRISTEEYRSRRDELLSRPGSGPPEANPFPPPFRWAGAHRADPVPAPAGTPAPGDADRTQLVRPTPTTAPTPTTEPDADSTQLVRTRLSPTAPDADSTQLVRAGGSARAPSRPDRTSPPWHRGDEFTPRPGLDPFEQFRTRGGRSRVRPTVTAGAAVAVVLVAAVVVVVVLVLVRDRSSTSAAPTSGPSGTTAAPAPTSQAPSIASLPGKQLLDTTFATFGELQRAKVLSPDELAALEPARPLGTHLRVNQDGSTTTTVWTCAVNGDASAVVGRLTSRSAGTGFVPVRPSVPDVAALEQRPVAGRTGPGALRASYANGTTVVHVESRGPDPAAAGTAFRAALDAELASLPAR